MPSDATGSAPVWRLLRSRLAHRRALRAVATREKAGGPAQHAELVPDSHVQGIKTKHTKRGASQEHSLAGPASCFNTAPAGLV